MDETREKIQKIKIALYPNKIKIEKYLKIGRTKNQTKIYSTLIMGGLQILN